MQTLRVSKKSSKLMKVNFKDAKDSAIDISTATQITFAIKDALIDGISARLTKSLTAATLTRNGSNVEFTFNTTNWAVLPVGEYVADFLIVTPSKTIRSNPFLLVITPVVVEA
jgi:hypothetical protein